MGNENSSPQIPLDFVVDIPVCTPGNEHSIHVHSEVEGSHDVSTKIKYAELSCPIATECLMKVNLPIGSGASISSSPENMEAKLKLVHQCVKDKINNTPGSSSSSVQPRLSSVPVAKTEVQVVPQRVRISTLCDGQYKRVPQPPPGSTRPRIGKDGFYIHGGRGPDDFISVQLDKLTCKEALRCMNKLELSFDGTEGPIQVKKYRDTKNRTLDELHNSIRNQCVNSPTSPFPSPPPPSPPPSTDDATEVDDFMGMGVSQNVVFIGFGGAVMAAAALAL